LTDTIKFV